MKIANLDGRVMRTRVGIVGAGPAGLTAAQDLTWALINTPSRNFSCLRCFCTVAKYSSPSSRLSIAKKTVKPSVSTDKKFIQLPKNLWQLDESYRNMIRELGKR